MEYLVEEKRNIPVTEECDVLVCGGGVSGCAAALSAARNGARVTLIEKDYMLGGLATKGLISVFLPLCDGKGNQMIGGIAEEFFKSSIELGPGKIPECWQNSNSTVEERTSHRYTAEFNSFWFAISLEKKLVEAGIRIIYDTRLCNCICKDEQLQYVIVENKSGRSAIKCKSAVDATGDADLCTMCGEETVSLDSNRRAGWFNSLSNGKTHLHILGDIFHQPVPEGHRTFSGDNYEDVTAFCIDSRNIIHDEIIKLRSQEDTADTIPTAIPSMPLMRKTRRLKGLHEINEEDSYKYSRECIGMTGYYRFPGLRLYFPYQSLIGKTRNILAAGRCISSKEEFAWNITRGIPSSSVTGQAAGLAAALCAMENTDVQNLDAYDLQCKLIESGCIIHDFPDQHQ